ncbi:Golgi membrane exchange factor (Ric1p-Rgp1p) subunit [Stygiomarasmius scandens]|uniref:Golgi membrane exchange factor (Ric1p-Rgp1p) subunit n=1 Tax=Marasmiellus scandens TaxID=2682957 RepID=A0ABR1JUJ2_9AGAR
MSDNVDDFPIRVVVTPSQSAYFAGEPFSVKITFTNTVKPDAGPSTTLQTTTVPTRTHKRASHSISSAPIAKPPTSPAGHRLPRTPSTSVSSINGFQNPKEKEEKDRPARRGLIGKARQTEEILDVVEERRKKMLGLSLQTDGLADGVIKSSRSFTSPSSPKVPSPLSRSETLPLAASHPHARKNSYMDGQQSIHINAPLGTPANISSPLSPSVSSPLRNDITSVPFNGPSSASSSSASLASLDSVNSTNNITAYPIPSTPSASTFSLALDPIAETTSPLSPGPGSAPIQSENNFPPTPPPPHRSSSSPSVTPGSHSKQPKISVQEATPVKGSVVFKDSEESPTKARFTRAAHGRTKSYSHAAHEPETGLGIGYPSSATRGNLGDFGQNQKSGDDGTQLILYSYAQLKGTVVLTPLPSPSSSRSISSAPPRPPHTASTPQTPYTPNPYSPNTSLISPSSSATRYGPTPLAPPEFPSSSSSTSFSHPSPQYLPPDPSFDPTLTSSQTLSLLRSSLLKSSAGAVGGGSMDIGRMTSGSFGSTSSLSSQRVRIGGHTRSNLSIDIGGANANLNLGSAVNASGAYKESSSNSGTRPPHRRSMSVSLGGVGMGLLNAFLGPLSPSPVREEGGRYTETMHASQSAPDVSSSLSASASNVPGNIHPTTPVSSQNPNGIGYSEGGRTRAVSASASNSYYSNGSSTSTSNLNSFGSFGSLGAWIGTPSPSSAFSSSGLGGSSGKEISPETPLPTFEVAPAMLAVDLALGPGEERSYTYTILLPPNLPPTFRGRTFEFTYELVVGVGVSRNSDQHKKRSSKPIGLGLGVSGLDSLSSSSNRIVSPSKGGPRSTTTSKIMQIPIRVYTNVIVGRSPVTYDLLWPIYKRQQVPGFAPGHRRGGRGVGSPLGLGKHKKGGGELYTGKVEEITKGVGKVIEKEDQSVGESKEEDKGLDELREYARVLVDSSTGRRGEDDRSISRATSTSASSSTAINGSRDDIGLSTVVGENRGNTGDGKSVIGCGEAVEILTRNPKKISYDVNKDGVKVAVLTFTKAAYRLGETVQGIVELNDRTSRARVVQLSAHLETHESLPTALASPPRSGSPASRQLKRVHAEHYSSFVLSTLRTTFSLDIPSDASAAFQIKVGDEKALSSSRVVSHTTNSAPGLSSSSTSLYPHSPLPNASTVPASAPAYPSTFPSSPLPQTPAFSPTPVLPMSPLLSSSSPLFFPIPPNSKPGGLEWKVRLCLLVAIASEDADPGTEDVRIKGLVRDEYDLDDAHHGRGEWGSSWKAVKGVGLEKVRVGSGKQRGSQSSNGSGTQNQGVVKSWASYFASSILGSEEETGEGDDEYGYDEDEDAELNGWIDPPMYDGIKPNRAGGVGVGVEYGNESKWYLGSSRDDGGGGNEDEGGEKTKRKKRVRAEWRELKVETVECEVPIRVWPGNTAYKPVDVVFDV